MKFSFDSLSGLETCFSSAPLAIGDAWRRFEVAKYCVTLPLFCRLTLCGHIRRIPLSRQSLDCSLWILWRIPNKPPMNSLSSGVAKITFPVSSGHLFCNLVVCHPRKVSDWTSDSLVAS
ncbi:hypothetical protein AVEN_161721-1 [Araneus ventricosus]|uniref:Uncharacterized protein n=1 Tax=Araneus ventricosus TaxID=182803 RepID=A0A4Y2UAS3_ARAVE|nr:hypothetical protein AVEN_161721-1 [Araneus ventricosus]